MLVLYLLAPFSVFFLLASFSAGNFSVRVRTYARYVYARTLLFRFCWPLFSAGPFCLLAQFFAGHFPVRVRAYARYVDARHFSYLLLAPFSAGHFPDGTFPAGIFRGMCTRVCPCPQRAPQGPARRSEEVRKEARRSGEERGGARRSEDEREEVRGGARRTEVVRREAKTSEEIRGGATRN